MSHPLFLESEFAPRPAGDARFHVVSAPFEASVSYGGGTAGGPAAIIEASNQLEVFDGLSCPGEEGIHTWPPVDCRGAAAEAFPRISGAVRRAVLEGAGGAGVPVVLGGEHSITAPALAGLLEATGAATPGTAGADTSAVPLGVVQIDAHADLRDEYEGSRESHACVARRIHGDMGIPLLQIGVRSLSPEEVLYRAAPPNGVPLIFHDAPSIVPGGVSSIEIPRDFPPRVYISVDVDGLDPSVIPATGTPVPGGLGWYELLGILTSIADSRRVVGMDVVELAPIADQHAWTYAAAELAHRMMGIVARSHV